MSKNLRTYLNQVIKLLPNQIKIVDKEVDPEFGVSALIEKLEHQGKDPLVIFNNIKGSKIPLVINLAANYDRLALSLDTTDVDVKSIVEEYMKREQNIIPTKEVSNSPVKDIILKGKDIDLNILPIIKHNEEDPGKYISAGATLIKDPETGSQNLGLYRLQVQAKDELGLNINPASHGFLIGEKYRELGKSMEVAVLIGHHPAIIMSAVSKLEGYGGELEVAGGLLGEPVEVIKGETVDLLVPAEQEIVIEGIVNPRIMRDEGPFGEWAGYSTGRGPKWFIKITAITMRKNPIYQSIMAAHVEHTILGCLPRMGSLLRRIRGVLPTVNSVNLPVSGMGRVRCYISLKQHTDGEAKQAAFIALAIEPYITNIILVDDDIDVFNENQVLWALSTRFDAREDLIMMKNCLGARSIPTAFDITKHKHGDGNMQTKLIFDATRNVTPLHGEPFPKAARVPKEIVDKVVPEEYLKECIKNFKE